MGWGGGWGEGGRGGGGGGGGKVEELEKEVEGGDDSHGARPQSEQSQSQRSLQTHENVHGAEDKGVEVVEHEAAVVRPESVTAVGNGAPVERRPSGGADGSAAKSETGSDAGAAKKDRSFMASFVLLLREQRAQWPWYLVMFAGAITAGGELPRRPAVIRPVLTVPSKRARAGVPVCHAHLALFRRRAA